MSIPATVVYFTTYDRLKYAMGYNELDPSTKYLPIYAGVLARGMFFRAVPRHFGALGSNLQGRTTKASSQPCPKHRLKNLNNLKLIDKNEDGIDGNISIC